MASCFMIRHPTGPMRKYLLLLALSLLLPYATRILSLWVAWIILQRCRTTPWQYDEFGGPINWETFTDYVTIRLFPSLNFDYKALSPLPHVRGTFWSAMWVGLLNVRDDNVYTFGSSNLDDGARLYIHDMNGTPYCKDWIVLAPHKFVCEPIHLTAGLHGFRVDYAQGPVNDSSLNLQWSSPSLYQPRNNHCVLIGSGHCHKNW